MLNRSNFLIAALCAEPGDGKAMPLEGIYVTPEGTTACDGFIAATVSAFESDQASLFDEAEDVEPADFFTGFILPADVALKVAKAIPKKTMDEAAKYAVVDCTTEGSERAMLSVNQALRQDILRARKIEGQYPNAAKLIPSARSAKFTATLNGESLAALTKAVAAFCNAHNTDLVELTFHGEGKPLRIEAKGNGQNLVAIIMPGKASERESE